ncbi:transglycosylase domain-containing protein [Amycolatopsis taiwanensis]|uniref:Penicillin-binding protein n=1 Tax=Amycolatopsis taiwanensis TaxID=342230 RepID=A0A9W6R4S7_9PSEU|nr:transglycosylase domain-containing protein [Amycolatopsis taiwanensis]GLY67480.1 penicillin-binding protein [Amycolatopsis taiwanensis]
MNDQYNRSWPGQEPDEPRRAQWPAGDEPQWPGGNEAPPRAPRRPAPQWPNGNEQQRPARRPELDRTQRRVPPPPGRRPPSRQPGRPQGAPPDRPPRDGYRPPVPTEPEPEPSLLTHTELGSAGYTNDGYESGPIDAPTEFADDDPGEPETDNEGKAKPELTRRQRKKRLWRRVRRTLYVMAGLGVVIPAAAFTIAYFLVDVPTPEQVLADQSQVVTYYYADNTVMGKDIPDSGNRQILKPGEIPEVMKHAAYAAEDATFETNSGFDLTGIFRAVYNNFTGGTGGGSTISQQYIKKATENEEHTLTRKATELVKSFKLNRTQSKDEIIAGYLNIVFFGRGAYGVQAAAHVYFNKDAAQLTPSEAAFLAGLIQGPSRSENTEYTTRRWNYVMDNMVKYNWLPAADRQAAQYPTPQPKSQAKAQAISGPNAFIQAQVEDELANAGYPKERLQTGGYNIYTTIDPKAQQQMEQAVNDIMKGQPDELREAMVAVSPKDGGVVAYYGGPNKPGVDEVDWANTMRNPGSSFKPFDLTALLQTGKGLGETYNGTSPQEFGKNADGTARKVTNAGAANSCSEQCTVAEAMKISANTVFYGMVYNDGTPEHDGLGYQAVVKAANQAGINNLDDVHDANVSIGGGTARATALEMASSYATFAGDGARHPQHFVAKVTSPGGEVVYQPPTDAKPAFANSQDKSKQIAGNVTTALKPVIGFTKLTCPSNHECAGKTGTQQYKDTGMNSDVWMVGYTPSIAVSSWVGTPTPGPIKDKNGKSISSSGLPALMWQEFLTNYLKDKPAEKFPTVQPIGKTPEQATTSTVTTTTPPTNTTTPPSSPPESSSPETPSSSSERTRTRTSPPSSSRPNGGIILPPGNTDSSG